MCGCYFDLIGVCDLFSTPATLRPCICDEKECDFYVSEDDAVEKKAVKKYAIKQAVDKALKNLTEKDGD